MNKDSKGDNIHILMNYNFYTMFIDFSLNHSAEIIFYTKQTKRLQINLTVKQKGFKSIFHNNLARHTC